MAKKRTEAEVRKTLREAVERRRFLVARLEKKSDLASRGAVRGNLLRIKKLKKELLGLRSVRTREVRSKQKPRHV